jgi:hypothetical protein
LEELQFTDERLVAEQRSRALAKKITLGIAVAIPAALLISRTQNLFLWVPAIWFLYGAVRRALRERAYDPHIKRNPHLQVKTEDVVSIGELRAMQARGEVERYIDANGETRWRKPTAPKRE